MVVQRQRLFADDAVVACSLCVCEKVVEGGSGRRWRRPGIFANVRPTIRIVRGEARVWDCELALLLLPIGVIP